MVWVVNATPRPLYPRFPLYRRLGGPQHCFGRVRKTSSPPGFDPRTVQPVASRCTNWALPTHSKTDIKMINGKVGIADYLTSNGMRWVLARFRVISAFGNRNWRKQKTWQIYTKIRITRYCWQGGNGEYWFNELTRNRQKFRRQYMSRNDRLTGQPPAWQIANLYKTHQ